MILIRLGVQGIDFPLTKSVVEGVVYGCGRDTQARCGHAIDDQRDGAGTQLLIGCNILKLGQLVQFGDKFACPLLQFIRVGIFEGCTGTAFG